MAKTKKKNGARWSEWKGEHYSQIWKAMKKVLANESWQNPLSDKKLTAAIRDEGVYTTPTITGKVREMNNVGTADARRVELFAKSKGK